MSAAVKRTAIGGCLGVAAVLASFLVLRPALATEWALYVAPSAHEAYRLYLEPFPNESTCDVDRRIVVRNRGFARCESRTVLSFDAGRRNQLLWEFESPANPFARLCKRIAAVK